LRIAARRGRIVEQQRPQIPKLGLGGGALASRACGAVLQRPEPFDGSGSSAKIARLERGPYIGARRRDRGGRAAYRWSGAVI